MGVELVPPPLASPTSAVNLFDVRNVICNGDMGVAQRGNGPFTGGGLTADGCRQNFSTAMSSTRVATSLGAGAGVNGAAWAMQSVVSGQAGSNDFANLFFRIEDVRTLAGRQATLSFIASAATGTPKIAVEIRQFFGPGGGSASPPVTTAVQTVTIDMTATRYTVTFVVPSIVGKSLGVLNNDYLEVTLILSAGTGLLSPIGLQNNTFTITDVQLEPGPNATPFERLPRQRQLDWCQRYYYRMNSAGAQPYPRFAMGLVVSTTQSDNMIFFPVAMRTFPTFGSSAPNTFINYAGAAVQVGTAIAINAPTPWGCDVTLTTPAFATAIGQSSHFCANNLTAAYLEFSAEL